MTSLTIADLAKSLEADFCGDGDLSVSCVSHPSAQAQPGSIAMATSSEFVEMLSGRDFKAAVLTTGTDWNSLGLEAAIFIDRPRVAVAKVTQLFADMEDLAPGIHPTAQIDPSATLGKNSAVGAFVIVGKGAKIGDDARIMDHVSVGSNAQIGDNALLHSGVRIGRNIQIGDNAIIHQNSVIGSDGFSFVTNEPSSVELAKESSASNTSAVDSNYARIHSLAAVTIGDNVEIGACSTIDRGTLRDTSIGPGTKIDNQVQIGHNVQVGSDCLICAQVGLAGSVIVGDRVVLGGKSGVADHIKVGNDVLVAAASAVASNVGSGNIVMGVPAQNREDAMRSLLELRRLPRLFETVDKLRKRLSADKS